MAASKALTKALRDPHLNEEEKIEAAIRCARHHHMGFEPLARLRKDLLGEDASDLSIPEDNNRLEWIVRNIVSSLQTDKEEDLFPTCPTETQEEAADEEDEDNESERTTNVSPGRTTPSVTMSASSTVVEERPMQGHF